MMQDDPAYILDLGGDGGGRSDPQDEAAAARAWLGVQFDCCHVYSRVYRNDAGTAYVGRCPGCYREIRIGIGPGGSTERFFRAGR